MSLDEITPTRLAADGFERYYTEKLWESIPGIYRDLDGEPEGPGQGTLRALIELIGAQAALIRRDIDRLWDDEQIDARGRLGRSPTSATCSGHVPVSEQNTRGQRGLGRRGRSTTGGARARSPVLEALIQRHRRPRRRGCRGLPPARPHAVTGSIRKCPGWKAPSPAPRPAAPPISASPRILDIVDGPFDDLAHTLDVRRLRGRNGRYNIPKINFHLYRLQAFAVRLATPVDLGGLRFTLDPSGRDIDLFQPRQRPDEGEPWRPIREWEVPSPLICRRLNAARFLLAADDVPDDLFDELAPYAGFEFRTESGFRRLLTDRLNAAQLTLHLSACSKPR